MTCEALAENHYKGNKLIDILSQNIMRKQTYNGSWISPGPTANTGILCIQSNSTYRTKYTIHTYLLV